MACIRLSPSASVTPTGAGVLLSSDLGTFRLDGPDVSLFVSEMLSLLDGTHDREAVADALGEYSRQSVLAFLDLLEQRGLLETVSEAPSRRERWYGQEEFFRKWTDRPKEVIDRLNRARILIAGLEPWGATAAAELASAGVGGLHLLDDGQTVQDDDLLSARMWSNQHLGLLRREALVEVLSASSPWCHVTTGVLELTDGRDLALNHTAWDLMIGAVTADELLLLQSLTSFAHGANVPYLFGHLKGLDAVVGPAVIPGQTACWNCYRLRCLANSDQLQAAHALQTSLLSERPEPRTRTYLAPMAPLLGHLLALEALKLVSQYTASELVGRVLIQNLVTLDTTWHTIIRMPWCEVCGGASDSSAPQGGPVVGGQKEKDDVSENESRQLDAIRDPEGLREALAGWVDDRTGVIRRLVIGTPDATEPELPYGSSALLASYTEGTYRPGGTEVGSGKGLSPVESMISAVGEAIERYSAARYRKSDLLRSSLNDLEEDFLEPRRLCLYEEAQYADPDFPFARFDPDQPIYWTRGRWLDNGELLWVPALPTYFNFSVPGEELFCQVTSNGLAAGTTIEDAARRAVFELIERDAFMITWLCQRRGRRVLLDSAIGPGIREVVRQLKERGAEVELYLLDAGLSIPAVACLGLGDGRLWPGVTVSLAAHANPLTAVRKAILEQGHVGPYIRRLMLDGEHTIPNTTKEVRTLTDHALYYAPAHRAHVFDFLRSGDNPVSVTELGESLGSWEACIERLTAAGARIAIADVTSPDVAGSPFRVARALGADVQPIDFGFKLRRLANPRLKAMLTDGVNPHPHPLA